VSISKDSRKTGSFFLFSAPGKPPVAGKFSDSFEVENFEQSD
jgi:hypothetical protein